MKISYSCFVVLLLLMTVDDSKGQNSFFKIPRAATANVSDIRDDWNPVVSNREKEVADEFEEEAALNKAKENLLEKISATSNSFHHQDNLRNVLDTPYVWSNFQGNAYDSSVPNDNEIAVSNSGYLVSVMNSTVFMYDLNNDTVQNYLSLDAFCDTLGNSQSKYDPKVIYDPDQNKFIAVFLAGFTHTTSSIVVAFSQTDNPGEGWNFYELPGNPLNDTLWSDYPAIALTNEELFITVNHLYDNQPWQTGWKRSVIWQVNKFNGYNGDSLAAELHHDIESGGRGVRNLCPVKGGSKLYGPDIYFLSERNLDVENDTFFLVHLTDTIGSSSQAIDVQVLKSDVPYFVPINGKQMGGGDLATNDSRVLGAFYENDMIQFVGNTTDTSAATSAIYHGVIQNVSTTPAIDLHIVSDDTLSYGYPNISYAGNSSNDNTAIIDVLRSAVNVFLGYSALVTDGTGTYSKVKDVKDGFSYSSVLFGTERWGDYSGSQRKYDEPGKVWVNGSYGTAPSHKVSTWITELGLTQAPIGIVDVAGHAVSVSVFPNPFIQQFTTTFEMDKTSDCDFQLYDEKGILIRTLLKEKVMEGKNQFSFSLQPLTAGIYFLVISENGKLIASEKVIKE